MARSSKPRYGLVIANPGRKYIAAGFDYMARNGGGFVEVLSMTM